MMNGWPSSAKRRIIETLEIIVNQRRAVQQLNRGSCSIADPRMIFAAGLGNGQADFGPNPRSAGKHGVDHGLLETGRTRARPVILDVFPQAALNSFGKIHALISW
jgi:hypothetical protein